MEAASQVHRDPAGAQREAGGLDRAAGHQPLQVERLLDLALRDRHSQDAAERVGLLHGVEVVRRVYAKQVLERRRPGLEQQLAREQAGLLERAEHLVAAQRVERDAVHATLVASVVDERDAAAMEAEVEPARRADRRTQGIKGHREIVAPAGGARAACGLPATAYSTKLGQAVGKPARGRRDSSRAGAARTCARDSRR